MSPPVRGTPKPWDVALNAHGLKLVQAEGGALAYAERATPAPHGSGAQEITYEDWAYGIGIKRHRWGVPETQRGLYYSLATADGGGIDGSWGPLLPGPHFPSGQTVDSTYVIVKMVEFNGAWYCGTTSGKIIKNTDGIFTTASNSTVTTLASAITDLWVDQGTNSVYRIRAAQAHGPMYSSADGSTWVVDGNTAGRSGKATLVAKTSDGGATFTDYTNNLADSAAGTVADFSSLDTLANGDYILVGFSRPFYSLTWTMGTTNSNASVVAIHYWDGDSWEALSVTDGTINTGKTFGQSGTMSWTRPATAWAKTTLSETAQTVALFYVRISVSAALDASTTATTLSLKYNEEATKGVVDGKTIWMVRENVARWSTDGGITPNWIDIAGPFDQGAGSVIGMAVAQDVAFVRLTNGFGAVDTNGESQTFLHSLTKVPASDVYQAMFSWDGGGGERVYFGNNEMLVEYEHLVGPDVVGIERRMLNESPIRGTPTCGVGDRTHFAYVILYDGTTSYLMKWGGYVDAPDFESGGALESQRINAWHQIGQFTAKIVSCATWIVSGQPYLLLGDTAGVVRSCKLPKGASGLQSSSGYLWSIVSADAYWPTFYGMESTRALAAFAWSVTGRGLTANVNVSLATKLPNAGSWTTQNTITDGEAAASTALATAHSGKGIDLRVRLASNSTSTPARIDSLTLFWRHLVRGSRKVYSMTVLAEDGVVAADGHTARHPTAQWLAWLETARDSATPVAFVSPRGVSDTVLVEECELVPLPSEGRRSLRWGVRMVLSSAA